MDERNYYLDDIPLDEAKTRLLNALRSVGRDQPLTGEWVALTEAAGRITAEPVWAKISAPHYHAAAMDGYAVSAEITFGATETAPRTLELHHQAIPVNTGDPLPTHTNAVIMIEQVQHPDAAHILIYSAVTPWQHVRMMGEDMVATELVLPANHLIRPADIGAIAGCGHAEVMVRRVPHVVIIPTGSELVPATQTPQVGQIIEYNSLILRAQLLEMGALIEITDIIPDEIDQLRAALDSALTKSPDLLLVLSGSSAGSKDFTAAMIRDRGQLLVHGVAVRPGHPVIMGIIGEIPIIGVPGYPVSAALTGEIFIQPLIAHWLGISPPIETRPRLKAKMTRKLLSPIGDDDFVRVTVAQVGDQLLAAPLSGGAGVITSLVKADGLAHIPRFSEGVDAGQAVEILLYRPLDQIQRTILAIGSHDPMLDLMGQHLGLKFPGFRLSSANVGSMGGLVALRRKEAHLAGIHLLDPDTGAYNLPDIQRHLATVPVQVITFAHREQGLIVAKGNPYQINSFDDLMRVRYVNRQKGAGTRLLLDYELKQRGIDAASLSGYEREEYTHMAVAVAIASGSADCGLGVRSAAAALNLDFIPVAWERYDFVIPLEHQNHIGIQHLLETLNSPDFQRDLAAQPGYDIGETGKVIL